MEYNYFQNGNIKHNSNIINPIIGKNVAAILVLEFKQEAFFVL